MQRRKFIKESLKGLPLILMASSLLASSCDTDEITDPNGKTVVVVGAGISGLAAAKKLKEKGFNVIVLEAQDKVGGRLRTNRSLGIAFDEGASWIHGIDGNPITSLAQEAGMETFFTDDESIVSYDIGGLEITEDLYYSTEEAFYEVLETMMNNGNNTESFETVFTNLYPQYANNRLWKFFLSTYLTFDTGDLDNLSSLNYYEGEEFEGIEKISTVMLNQRVTKIDHSGASIKITHNGTITEADYVLVTVPLGVLKANVIEFTPTLPSSKQSAIQKMNMNCVNKFLLTWDTAFWDDVQYIVYTPEERDKYNYFVNVKKFHPNTNALMTFAYADYARLTETMSDQQIIEDIMLHLKDMYGADIPYPTNLLRTRWQSNENSYGSYSYTSVGSDMSDFEELSVSVNNKLFFAGEHTEVDYFSNAHGAYLSGIREADKIIDLL